MKKYEITEEELKQFIFTYLTPADKTAIKQLDDFLKSKSEIKYLDRKVLERLFVKYGKATTVIDKICNLAVEEKPAKYLSREEVEKIFDEFISMIYENGFVDMAKYKAVKQICSLAIDKSEVIKNNKNKQKKLSKPKTIDQVLREIKSMGGEV